MDQIRRSCFGKLFEIPLARCSNSGKLLHQLITRQLVTRKKYELWMVFGGHPLKFSLAEFAQITGLPCGDIPKDVGNKIEKTPDATWREIIGESADTTLTQICNLLEDKKTRESMSDDRKLKLALILIVDGVLIANLQHPTTKPTPRYVTMLSDLQNFLQYPWGRESCLITIDSLRPALQPVKKKDDPIKKFRARLFDGSVVLKGFPIALQLLAFKNIPKLLEWLPSIRGPHSLGYLSRHCSITHASQRE
ncbi:unnamed protein product [Microthlaspi erraticum]|uniref:DUF1985 domain-containing protein n=1 Tax=Microthlaspi erraticum TaxID=1685480 RepID=A0A6D2KPU8_9BRAS|nr:unnamed protein product [Microthlaspi erraticum]